MLSAILQALGLRRPPPAPRRYGRYGALLPLAYLGWRNRDRIRGWWQSRRAGVNPPATTLP